MSIRRNKNLIALLFIALSAGIAHAQEEEKSDCVIKLEQAQVKYNQGRIQDVEPLLSECLKGDEFNKVDKAQAYKLLTLSYLFLKESELAESTMQKLLETNHGFQINEAIDPTEFINLYNKFRTDPIISIGLLGGGVFAQPMVTQLNSTQNLSESTRQKYTPKFGYQIGINAEYKLMDKWYVNPGIDYSHIVFRKTDNSQKIVSNQTNGGFDGELNFNIFELPLAVQYLFLEGKIRPYAMAGIVPQFYSSAFYAGDVTSNAIDGSPNTTQGTIDLNKDLNKFNFAATISGGVKLKIPAGFINAQIRYNYGVLQVFEKSSALTPSNPNLAWDLYESLDGFKIQNIVFSIGYTYNVFIPKKLR